METFLSILAFIILIFAVCSIPDLVIYLWKHKFKQVYEEWKEKRGNK